jgi:uncharacterized membrane protein
MDYLKKLPQNKYLKEIVKDENKYSMSIATLLFVLAVMHIPLNLTLSKMVTSIPGLIVLSVLALTFLMQKSRLVMVLGLFVLYKIYHQSRDMVGVLVNSVLQESIFRKLTTEKEKDRLFDAAMDVPKTLEEEVVNNVAPMLHTIPKPSNKIHGDFKPVLSEIHGATPVSDL